MAEVGPPDVRERIRLMPKAHLHVHLEGAIRPATLREFAAREGAHALELEGWDDLPGFVGAYETARDLVASLEDLRRVAREIVEDAVADGFVWSEIHFSPLAYRGRLGAPEGLVEAVLDGIRAGTATTSTGAALILGHNRADPEPMASRTLDLALRFAGDGVVGLGLVGDERHPAEPFRDMFVRARANGLACVPHAGETGMAEAVRHAVQVLGADRVGHGVAAATDAATLALLVERDVCLDVCPTSNVRLGVASRLDAHPLPQLVEAGVTVTLNSDDPTFFGASALDEYVMAESVHGIDVRAIARASLTHSAAPRQVRGPALRSLDGAGP